MVLGHAVAELRAQGETLPDTLLGHVSPLGWEHISFNGDYVWPSEPFKDGFRPRSCAIHWSVICVVIRDSNERSNLRNPRFEFLDAA